MARRRQIRWAVIAQMLFVFLLAQGVQLPGLHPDMPLAAQRVSAWTFAAVPWQPLSLVCVSLAPLLIVRTLVAVARPEHLESGEAQGYLVRGFVTYLFVVTSLALAVSWELEHLRLADGTPAVIGSPGLFRARTVLVLVGVAALTWEFATQISRVGVVKGPLLLFGVAVGARGVLEIGELMVAVAHTGNAISPALLWRTAALVLPFVAVMLAFWRFDPGDFPLTVVRGAELLSPVGALLIPWIIVGLADSTLANLGAWFDLRYEALQAIRLLIGLAIASGIARWLSRYAIGAGSPQWGLAAVGVLAAPLPIMALVRLAVYTPGPFAGDRDWEVVVRLRAGGGEGDVDVLRARLDGLHIAGDVRRASTGQLRVRLHNVVEASEVMAALLPRHEVTVHLASDQRVLLRDMVALRDAGLTPTSEGLVGRAVDLRRYLATLSVPVEAGRVALHCGGLPAQGETTCSAWFLEEPPILTRDDIVSTAVAQVPDRRAWTRLTLTTEGERHLCRVTEGHVGRAVAVSVDGDVRSLQIVETPLCSGVLDVEAGAARRDALRDSAALAASAGAGRLTGRWEVESVWPLLSAP